VPSVIASLQATLLAQVIEYPENFAAVAGSDCLHDLEERFRPGREDFLDRTVIRHPVQMRYVGDREFRAALGSERYREIEPDLRPEPGASKRWIERNCAHPGHYKEIVFGLETSGKGPFHLLIGTDIDIIIPREGLLHVCRTGEDRRQRVAGLSRVAGTQ